MTTKKATHVHRCPACYEAVPCPHPIATFLDWGPLSGILDGTPIFDREDGCTISPDLALDDGTPCGCYSICERCTARLITAATPDADHFVDEALW